LAVAVMSVADSRIRIKLMRAGLEVISLFIVSFLFM
jgi:hypothetical protein